MPANKRTTLVPKAPVNPGGTATELTDVRRAKKVELLMTIEHHKELLQDEVLTVGGGR